jgi:hypothetical protein
MAGLRLWRSRTAKPNNSHSTIGEKPATITEMLATIERLSENAWRLSNRRRALLPLRLRDEPEAQLKTKKRKPSDLERVRFGGFSFMVSVLMAVLH